MGNVWEQMKSYNSRGVDVFKSAEWYSRECAEDCFERACRTFVPPLTWPQWIKMTNLIGVHEKLVAPPHNERWTRLMLSRDLYFSIRLEQLFRRAKVKGQMVRLLYFKDLKPTPEDEAWVEEKLALLAKHGLADAPKSSASQPAGSVSQKWFKQFLKRNAKKGNKSLDFATVEKKQKLALPGDYKKFIASAGSMTFEDIMETEGFTATVLPPAKLDFKGYRRDRIPELDEEQSQIDGVMFAETDHGDAFVFDISTKGEDYPVFWHDHEQNTLEPFASNFAECIKRFSQKN